MRQTILRIFVAIAFVLPAAAQQSHGYVFLAPGSVTGGQTSVQGGAGFEAMVYKRLIGAGAEASYLTTTRDWGGGIGVVSPNAYVHIPVDRFSGIDPYFTLGYSLLFRSGTKSAFNYGGGMNWWFHSNLGLKLELRDHTTEGVHYWGIRFGLNFR